MKKATLFLSLLLLVGCETVQTPPKRPVAYLFPTVRTVRSMQGLTPQHCTKDRLNWALNTAGVGLTLQRSGMLDMDYDVIVRGLSQRGFAEVDARRANAPFRWLTFSFLPDGRLEIMACFRHRPVEFITPGMVVVKTPSPETLNACRLTNTMVTQVQLEITTTLRRELVEQRYGKENYWVMRWLFH
ncbi:MAG: hypothetical protein J6X49_01825 [Victivallales bacterium]|nr:hypothetical protein [Victivallales bacterium]